MRVRFWKDYNKEQGTAELASDGHVHVTGKTPDDEKFIKQSLMEWAQNMMDDGIEPTNEQLLHKLLEVRHDGRPFWCELIKSE
jgi:hypothetical protein